MRRALFPRFKQFRYERKFSIENCSKEYVENILKFHPSMFREIFFERNINNIYFDSFNFAHFFDNINGTSSRIKVRIRWYGELFGFINNPVLEIKLKHNLHVGKLFYPITAFTLDKTFTINTIVETLAKSDLPEIVKLHLQELNPTIINSYTRKYYLSADKIFRATIDDKQKAYKISFRHNNFFYNIKYNHQTILELKYDKHGEKTADWVTNHLPFRMTKNSKYINGVTGLFS